MILLFSLRRGAILLVGATQVALCGMASSGACCDASFGIVGVGNMQMVTCVVNGLHMQFLVYGHLPKKCIGGHPGWSLGEDFHGERNLNHLKLQCSRGDGRRTSL